MIAEQTSVANYESLVRRFQPEQGLAATNSNDLRRFLYEWFTHFEHAAPVDFLLDHLAGENLDLRFPGSDPITSHAAFAAWYEDLLTNTLWNFHDLSAIQIKQTAAQEYLLTFVLDWYGEVRADSDQVAGWQSRSDSRLYHHFIRQTWTIGVTDRPVIQTLVAAGGDTPLAHRRVRCPAARSSGRQQASRRRRRSGTPPQAGGLQTIYSTGRRTCSRSRTCSSPARKPSASRFRRSRMAPRGISRVGARGRSGRTPLGRVGR